MPLPFNPPPPRPPGTGQADSRAADEEFKSAVFDVLPVKNTRLRTAGYFTCCRVLQAASSNELRGSTRTACNDAFFITMQPAAPSRHYGRASHAITRESLGLLLKTLRFHSCSTGHTCGQNGHTSHAWFGVSLINQVRDARLEPLWLDLLNGSV